MSRAFFKAVEFIVAGIMESFMANAAKSYFQDHRAEQFGATAVYVAFEYSEEVRHVSLDDLSYQFVVGHIVYRNSPEGVSRHRNLLIRYFEVTATQPGMLRGLVPLTREVDFSQTTVPMFDRWKPVRHLFLELCFSSTAATMSANRNVVVWLRPVWCDGLQRTSATLSYAHCSLMLRRIAEFHACSLHVETVYSSLFQSLNFADPEPLFFDTESVLPMLDRCLQPLYQDSRYQTHCHRYFRSGVTRLKEILETFVDHLNAPFVRSSTGNHCWVMCHKNYGQHSVLFEYDKGGAPVDSRIFNCQSTNFASLAVDLVVPLFVELDASSRAQYFDTLVAEYCAKLQQTGSHFVGPSLQLVASEIRKAVPYALYVLAGRIVAAQAELEPGSSFFQPSVWKEHLITDLYVYLIVAHFV